MRILVIVLLFGMTLVGNLEAQTDSRLNGKWVFNVEGREDSEYTFNNGNYEEIQDGVPRERGIYTTTDSRKIIFIPTHVFGGSLKITFNALDASRMELKWYSMDDFFIALRPILEEFGVSDEYINDAITRMSSESLLTYTVNANTLIMTFRSDWDGDIVTIWNKR
jgi:hypothetical protein